MPGELDTAKDGLVAPTMSAPIPPTWLFNRGDERTPDTDRAIMPGVPKALCGDKLDPDLHVATVVLPKNAAHPDRRAFVIRDTIAASEKALEAARKAFEAPPKDGKQQQRKRKNRNSPWLSPKPNTMKHWQH